MPHFNLSSPVLKQHYLKFLFILLPVLFYTNCALAQTLVTSGNISSPPAAGEYYHPTGITLSPGFSFTATAGQSFRAYISGSVCIPLAATPSGNQNYVTTYVPRAAGIANPADPNNSNCQVMQTIQYLDGLGRPLQTVQVKGSPTGLKDVVEPATYDGFGREAVRYLPYTTDQGTPGSYRADALNGTNGYANSAQKQFYNQPGLGYATIPSPYSVTNYEASSLNRPVEQGAPGDPWQPSASGISGSGHVVKTDYGTNVTNEVRLWQVNAGGNGASWNNSFYDANQLYKTTITDENGNHTVAFKDKQNQVVLKQAEGNNGYLSTYYVYNDLGNLAYVVPPVPQNVYPQSFSEQDQVFGQYLYGYHYDYRNRMMEKKLPGKGWEFIVYNTLDQVVMTQDANQRNKTPQQWTFTKYDGQGRAIMTGIWTYGNSQATTNADNSERLWLENYYATTTEPKWETKDNTTSTGYNNLSTPAGTNYTFLTINYYDDYSFPGADALGSPAPNTVAGQSANVQGLLTGGKVNILGTGTMLLSVNYYDDKGRVLQSKSQNHLGGQDIVGNTYGFTGELLAGNRSHTGTNGSSVTIANRYGYDHMGRKTETWQKMDSGNEVQLSKLEYNEVGQLKGKSLGGGLQTTSYAYNERGWLTKINDPATAPTSNKLFSMELRYNLPALGATAQWNGNISEQAYNAGISGSQWVKYSYDKLNRLTDGQSSAGFSETGISYDQLGNIGSLSRGGPGSASLIYSYQGNQLSTVTNNGNPFRSYGGYDPNGNATTDGIGHTVNYNMLDLPQNVPSLNLSYTYTATGEKLRKTSNGATTDYISGIQYKADGTIDFIQTEEGRAIRSGGSYNYEYTLSDHLGNNRVTFDQVNGKVGEEDYYPFGLNIHRQTNAGNKYLYNKKEVQEELNNQYDYGARFYDPVIGRMTTIDPMAEAFDHVTPYNYALNNPILMIDPDGMAADSSNKPKPPILLNEVEVKSAPNRPAFTGFIGNANYLMNLGNFDGYHYNKQGKADGLAPIMGFPPALSTTGLSWNSMKALIKLLNPKNWKVIFTSVDELIEAAGELSPTRKGALQGTIKGVDIEKVFDGLSKGGQKLSSGAVKLPDGTIIKLYQRSSNSNPAIFVNKMTQSYKIEILP